MAFLSLYARWTCERAASLRAVSQSYVPERLCATERLCAYLFPPSLYKQAWPTQDARHYNPNSDHTAPGDASSKGAASWRGGPPHGTQMGNPTQSARPDIKNEDTCLRRL